MSETPKTEERKSIPVRIEDEMRGAYLDYAMSVIIGRALPDVRDGLKHVHRRSLFAMYDLGNTHDKAYKKSARIVGDVIGKYHPHGDSAVYDSIVRMAQDFSLRYPLVDGQGNFGSIDGDSPAHMRYTEVRMAKITQELLADLDKETVDFGPNYDDTLKEPLVFPSKFPNLMVNGSSGIAVGMATNIPPHNLTEVIDAAILVIDRPTVGLDELIQIVKGPDFPSAGQILGMSGIKEAYKSGRGIITIRGQAEIEIHKNDRERIIVTELPYQVNKARLIEKIAELVNDKKIEGISDLRDESDRKGMRIVIDIKKGENSSVILNRLYKLTQLQDSFGISFLAIHHGQPKFFGLKPYLQAFIEHRRDVVVRRTIFELGKAEARAHILEGLKIAVENIDAVIKLIRAAQEPTEAKATLIEKFSLSEKQAQAILDMRLQRLTGLEREKIIQEYKEVIAIIEGLKKILANESLVFGIIKKELTDIKEAYGDERKTKIVLGDAEAFEVEDLIADEEVLVSITHKGYIRRTDPNQFKAQHRGGRGIKAASTNDDDFVSAIYQTTNHSYLLCFTDKGKLYWLKVFKIPEQARTSKGKAIVNLLNLGPGEKICAILPVKQFNETEYVVMVTKEGVIKKTPLSEFKNVRTNGILAISFNEGDQLISAKRSHGKQDVFLCSKEAMCIRFAEDDVRPMGRTARGVGGMNLDEGDKIVAMEILDSQSTQGSEVLTITAGGYGKRTEISEYRLQSRGGKGIISMKTNDKTGRVVYCSQVLPSDEIMVVSSKGKMIRMKVSEISEQGRVTQGVRVMTVESGEEVVAVETISDRESVPNGSGTTN